MIYEDEDELGYWMGAPEDRPSNPWVTGGDASLLIICNSILSPEERDDIEAAAFAEEEGNPVLAEEHRYYAGYSEAQIDSDPR